MLTDEELDLYERSLSWVRLSGDRERLASAFAQAREANRLRAELVRLRVEANHLQYSLTLLSNQHVEMHKVVEAAGAGDTVALIDALKAYDVWLATHPHVDYRGTVTVQPGKGGEQT